MGRLSPRDIAIGTFVLVLSAAGWVFAVSQGASLVRNGTFHDGSAGIPEGWRTEAWSKELSQFVWSVDEGEGTISIVSPKPNDARWCQSIQVEPGASYRVAARVKTSDVGATTAGALIAVEPRIADTPDIRGTNDWRTLEVTVTAGEESSWDICPRLGSYASLNTGTAWYRDVTVTQIGTAPAKPGVVARGFIAVRSLAPPNWITVAVPLTGGVLLAFGLGIFRRRD
jgi:hypothetical protein